MHHVTLQKDSRVLKKHVGVDERKDKGGHSRARRGAGGGGSRQRRYLQKMAGVLEAGLQGIGYTECGRLHGSQSGHSSCLCGHIPAPLQLKCPHLLPLEHSSVRQPLPKAIHPHPPQWQVTCRSSADHHSVGTYLPGSNSCLPGALASRALSRVTSIQSQSRRQTSDQPAPSLCLAQLATLRLQELMTQTQSRVDHRG